MCGAFNLEHDIVNYLKSQGYHFDDDINEELEAVDYFPKGNSVVLRGNKSPRAELLKWYYPLGDGKTNVFNCRSESVFEKRLFKSSVENRRCIIPVSKYYEWSGEKSKKIKYSVFSDDGEPFFLGGIFNRFKEDNQHIEGFSIMTKDSFGDVKDIHHRMPIVIGIQDIKAWLDNSTELNIIKDLIHRDVALKVKLS